MSTPRRPYDTVKRLLDIAFAALLLALLLPFLVLIAVAIAVRMGAPVLFRQRRPGRDAQLFTLLKFRTMAEDATASDAVAAVGTDATRLTGLGRFLRSTSLDELPQLWNILVGQMSFVGPRPWLVEYLPYYTPEEARRHDVRPGLTGWAQVNGRNTASWDDRLAYDVWYVDHRSIGLDARIVGRTVGQALRREGISGEGVATAIPFVESRRASADNQPESDTQGADA